MTNKTTPDDDWLTEDEQLDKMLRTFEYGERGSPSHLKARANLKALLAKQAAINAKITELLVAARIDELNRFEKQRHTEPGSMSRYFISRTDQLRERLNGEDV